jgi:hypothetical protein
MKQALEERGCPTGSMMNCDAKRSAARVAGAARRTAGGG